jgi:hypothetical protein
MRGYFHLGLRSSRKSLWIFTLVSGVAGNPDGKIRRILSCFLQPKQSTQIHQDLNPDGQFSTTFTTPKYGSASISEALVRLNTMSIKIPIFLIKHIRY